MKKTLIFFKQGNPFLFKIKFIGITRVLLIVLVCSFSFNQVSGVNAGKTLNDVIPDEELQPRRINGTITDESRNPLPGVNIQIEGTTVGVISDISGRYSLEVPNDRSVLVFSFIGYTTRKENAAGKTVVDVQMLPDVTALEEVVVIGYGTIKKKDMTGSVASVKSEDISMQKPQNVQDILRGNVSGLEVGFSATAKGEGTLEIRGDNSIKTTSYPLIVLNGVIYPGALEDINPNDIEAIDVLKDASSAAVFGARAANGVILITTKKGKQGKPIINLNSSVGLATMATMEKVRGPYEFINWRVDVMKSMNLYNPVMNKKLYINDDPNNLPEGVTMEMWRDGLAGDPMDIWLSRLGFGPIELANYKAGKYVDWADVSFQNGLRQDHNLSLSGVKDDVTYYWSLGYNNNKGIIVGDQFKTIRSLTSLDAKVTSWLNVGMNIQFSNRDESAIPADWSSIDRNPPWGSMYLDDGITLRESPVDDLGRSAKNPIYDRSYQNREKIFNNIMNSLYANIKLPFGISYQMTFSPRFQWYQYLNHQSALHASWSKFGGQATREQSSIYSWQMDNIIKWNKTFNNIHQFDVTLLANAEKYRSWQNLMSTQGFSPTDALGYHNMSAGKSTSNLISSNDEKSTGDALMARMIYSLKSRYIVTLSVRRDGYSAFGTQNPHGVFPAAALAWVFTDENFFKNDILTYGKLRFSWGINGNREIGRYDALSDMSIGKYPFQPLSGSVYESNQLYVNRMANPLLTWEKTKAVNFGFDFSIFKDGFLNGSIEVYRISTLDLLIDRKLPDILGFSSVAANLGEVQNSGFEMNLNTVILKKRNLNWQSNVNFYLNRNKIVHLYGDMIDIRDDSGNVIGQKEADDETNKWFIGHALDQIWEPKILGVWQLGQEADAARYGQFPGDFRLEDVNDDGKINNLDNEFQGYKQPRFRWNMRHEFNIFNNLNVSFTMYSYWGHFDTYNVAKNRSGYPERNNSYITPYWTPENPLNDYARIFSAEGGAVFNVWKNKSFIRLDNLSVAYTIPASIVNKIKVSSLKFYGTVRNVGFWAPEWKYWDPENSGPNPRYFTLGVNMTL
jgi:TonB-linked SusC/RagA family outer membrane protein